MTLEAVRFADNSHTLQGVVLSAVTRLPGENWISSEDEVNHGNNRLDIPSDVGYDKDQGLLW